MLYVEVIVIINLLALSLLLHEDFSYFCYC